MYLQAQQTRRQPREKDRRMIRRLALVWLVLSAVATLPAQQNTGMPSAWNVHCDERRATFAGVICVSGLCRWPQ